ncbi:hypothetical protein PFICI_06418 [Pestalotiopsis fici W106-1]|uniref:Uncharacterized protein n=1 Tax=Pestalotiopsis fici (strain W106-1 / CGMCC3.15140) TaxID=1229662 RepID=W3X8A2_PESFW|nr:uncharacterized protein PFICI_06418 [Pestalotiopsis fici W106-1]ETS81416.1 hypothetical protein PFICI_06418 [Pestalotiopsis fici W106-1]
MSLLSPHYVLQPVTQNDMIVASLAWGFNIGFGWLTTWTAAKQTTRAWRRSGRHMFRNAYVWMIWLELLVCLMFSIICWLYLRGVIPPCFGFYFGILTLWALQVQFLLQIIINRCAILVHDPAVVWRLKVGVAILITAVNVSVYLIWIPARLQISERYIWINDRWDRCEKVIYLLVDAALNIYFITIVSKNLVHNGLDKYKRLARFNLFIIGFSLSMDVLIIGMMSLQNTFVYMQFHPLAYTVKLNIEMSMADLIVKVARAKNRNNISHPSMSLEEGGGYGHSSTTWRSKMLSSVPSKRGKWYGHNYTTSEATPTAHDNMEMSNIPANNTTTTTTTTNASDENRDAAARDNKSIYTTREVHVEFENAPQRPGHCWPSHYGGVPEENDDDEQPLQRQDVHLRSSRL